MSSQPDLSFDVVIIGGALAGASTALLLLRERPQLRVLIVEKSGKFNRRVGEATVEVSACFLGRVLGLTRHLNEAHLVKQGMRFWFANQHTANLQSCSEIGGAYLARVPAYQVDRAVLDQEVLDRAVQTGALLWREFIVTRVDLCAGNNQVVHLAGPEGDIAVQARWVVDASGVAAILARQQKWLHPTSAHPTTSVWARWTGVKDWDGLELARKYPEWAEACYGIRTTATNHLLGPGWWAWCIPLKGGDTSVGVVFDQRFVAWPQGGSLGERLKNFLLEHPAGREIMSDARWIEGDVHLRKNLPYCSSLFAGDGFALVGDAAGFIDPFYSPGMDWLAFTVSSTSNLILAHAEGKPIRPLLDHHNRVFSRSYHRWFEAIYRDKYEYMGDYELMRLAFLLDLGFYYVGVASQPFKRGKRAFLEPVFSTSPSVPFYYLIRAYNHRFAAMARSRRARGIWGRRNHAQRFMFPGYTFSPRSLLPLVKALLGWLALELKEGWRSWFGSKAVSIKSSATLEPPLVPVPASPQPIAAPRA